MSPLLCIRGALVLSSPWSSFGGWQWWTGVFRGNEVSREVGFCEIPVMPTWRGWALRYPLTGDAAHWSGALAPRILVCSGGWRAPKWSQSYSWRIRMSWSRIVSTLWPGDWLTFLGLLSTPPPAVHPLRRKGGSSAGAAGGKPPGTSDFSPFRHLEAPHWILSPVCWGVSVHDTHVVNTVCPLLPEVISFNRWIWFWIVAWLFKNMLHWMW